MPCVVLCCAEQRKLMRRDAQGNSNISFWRAPNSCLSAHLNTKHEVSSMAARSALAPFPNGSTARLSMAPQRKSIAPTQGMSVAVSFFVVT